MHRRSYFLPFCALLAFCLRALIPGGLMPAATADGWFLQLCPKGLSAASISVLVGDSHHHHHHHADSAEQTNTAEAGDCKLGGGVSALPTIAAAAPTLAPQPGSDLEVSQTHAPARSAWRSPSQPRAPPTLTA